MQNKRSLRIREIAVFAMLGTVMFTSKIVMEALPNIHLLGVLTVAYTVVFRWKALLPLYVYIFLNGLYAGFATWWVPYLYVWTVLWGATMLLPKRLPQGVAVIVYPALCALHGLFFGVLYAPGQALLYGLSFEETVAWIAAGLPFDLLHTVGNLAAGLLVFPIVKTLRMLRRRMG
jgi:uncharacterized membrane protein YgdD (TMEM256/DUF423 family)